MRTTLDNGKDTISQRGLKCALPNSTGHVGQLWETLLGGATVSKKAGGEGFEISYSLLGGSPWSPAQPS